MWYGFTDIVCDTAGLRTNSKSLRNKEFWANNKLSFEVRKGERLGIIGPNGSGKTTLLKMLNGILRPDKGTIKIKGRVGALIAVGAGFHPQLTGRENIYINGSILGMSKRQIDRKFDSIVDFANAAEFLDTPVKFYSSGMFVKLGFAVAAHCEPDILLIDEVLAVGDLAFQAKCLNRLAKLREKGVTTLLVSHHMPKIGSFCERVLYLSDGKIKLISNATKAIDAFEQDMYKEKNRVRTNGECCGYTHLGGARIKNVLFENKNDGEIKISYSEPIKFSFEYDLMDKNPADCTIAILVKRVCDGIMCFGALSNFHGLELKAKTGKIEVSVEQHNLVPGLYNIDTQIRTISHDNAYAAHREPKMVVTYPNDKYILRNIAGIYQPNKITWNLES